MWADRHVGLIPPPPSPKPAPKVPSNKAPNLQPPPLTFSPHATSHLPTSTDDDIQIRHLLPAVPGLRALHHAHDVHAGEDLAEDDVLAVQEGRRYCRDEELRAVAVGAGVLGEVSWSPFRKGDILGGMEGGEGKWGVSGRGSRGWGDGEMGGKEGSGERTAMDSKPGSLCFRMKFSSSNVFMP